MIVRVLEDCGWDEPVHLGCLVAGWLLIGWGVSPLVDVVCLWLMAEMRDRDSGVLSECWCLYCCFQVELGDMSLFLPSLAVWDCMIILINRLSYIASKKGEGRQKTCVFWVKWVMSEMRDQLSLEDNCSCNILPGPKNDKNGCISWKSGGISTKIDSYTMYSLCHISYYTMWRTMLPSKHWLASNYQSQARLASDSTLLGDTQTRCRMIMCFQIR